MVRLTKRAWSPAYFRLDEAVFAQRAGDHLAVAQVVRERIEPGYRASMPDAPSLPSVTYPKGASPRQPSSSSWSPTPLSPGQASGLSNLDVARMLHQRETQELSENRVAIDAFIVSERKRIAREEEDIAAILAGLSVEEMALNRPQPEPGQ